MFLSMLVSCFFADTEYVKKSFLFITAFFFLVCLAPVSTLLFAQEAGSSDLDSLLADSDEPSALEHESVPALLSGIWADDSRYVVFDSGYYGEESGRAIPNVVLRTFYQWYDDRAGEPSAYSAEVARDRNVAQTLKAEGMELQFIPLTDELYTAEYDKAVEQEDGDVLTAEEKNSGAWDIVVKYSGHKLGGEDTYHVPVAVIGDKLHGVSSFPLRLRPSEARHSTLCAPTRGRAAGGTGGKEKS